MLGGLSRIGEGSYFWMSPNSCSSSQMAANIAGLSLDRPWMLVSPRKNQAWCRPLDGIGMHHRTGHGKTSPNQGDHVQARLYSNP